MKLPPIIVLDTRRHAKRGIGGAAIVQHPADDGGNLASSDNPDGSLSIVVGRIGDESPKVRGATKFDDNLAKDVDEGALGAIAEHLLEGIEADLQSRKEWEDTANQAAKYLGITLNEPATSVGVEGTVCQSISTVMLELAIKLWGVARGELLPVGGPVKVRRDKTPELKNQQPSPQPVAGIGNNGGPPMNGQPEMDGSILADALEVDMNHYLTAIDREYYPDFSKMLFSRAIIGNAFRKIYRCPLRRRPVSVWVKAEDMLISNDCSHLAGAGRVTERVRVRQSVMRRLMVSGHYRDIPLVMPTGEPTQTELSIAETEGIAATPQLPEDQEHMVYECYCELGSTARTSLIGDLSDLDKDETGKKPGYPLPYRVSIDRDSRTVLEIRRNWKKGDRDHRPRQRYVKYGFIPGLGFWDLGLIHIIGNPTQSATMIQRAMVDAGLFANFPGGVFLKGPGSRQQDTVIRPNPGEFKGIDGGGAQSVQNVLMPLPYKEPSANTIAMGQKLEFDARRLSGIVEIPLGEGRTANIPVGTIMSYMELVSQVPGAVHKDDHISQQQEFELLRELFAEDPKSLTAGARSPSRRWETAAEIMDAELVPAADPNTPSQLHRLLKLQGLVVAGGMPQFQGIANQRVIWARIARYLADDNPDEYTLPPQPAQAAPPDPKIVAAKIKADSDTAKANAALQETRETNQTKLAEASQELQQRSLDRQSEETRAAMSLAGDREKLAAKTIGDHADRLQDQAQHRDTHGLETAKTAAQLSGPLTGPLTGGD